MSTPKPRFEVVAPTHVDACYNLARWLVRDPHAAEDLVQEAYLRAFRYYDSFHGEDVRPWLLSIVRNCCYTWLRKDGLRKEDVEFDEERDSEHGIDAHDGRDINPEMLLLRKQTGEQVNRAIDQLPAVYREALILRELEDLSYEAIALVAGIPLGTVMSRLSRARAMLRALLRPQLVQENG